MTGPVASVQRRRLIAAGSDHRVVVLAAASGFGKSTLADQLTEDAPRRLVVSFAAGDAGPDRVAARLAETAFGAGFAQAADAASGEGSPATRVESFARRLADTLVPGGALVLDDVHHLDAESRRLISAVVDRVASRSQPVTVIVCGRVVDPVPQGAHVFTDADLAFDAAEVESVFVAHEAMSVEQPTEHIGGRRLDGLSMVRGRAAECRRATGGWPAAVAMWSRHGHRRGFDQPRVPADDTPAGSFAALFEALARPLSAPRRRLLATLPLWSEAVGVAVGWPEVVDDLIRGGFPVQRAGRWWVLGDIARDQLDANDQHRAGTALDPSVAAAAADVYAGGDELLHAVDLLVGAGADHELAALVARLDPDRLERHDLQELTGAVLRLPDAALHAAPGSLLAIAIAASSRALRDLREQSLERLDRLGTTDTRWARRLEVERVYDLAPIGEFDEADRRGKAVLAHLADDDGPSRVRCLFALGQSSAMRGDPRSMVRASALLSESAGVARSCGLRTARAKSLSTLAYSVLFSRGEFEAAIVRIEEAVSLSPLGSRSRGTLLTYAGDILGYLGKDDEALDAVAEARSIARSFGDARTVAYAAWTGAKVAGRQRDRAALVHWLADVDEHRAEWFDNPSGAEFLSVAAELSAAVGDETAARRWLARCLDHPSTSEFPDIAWAAAASIECRWGDPAVAEVMIERLLDEGFTELRSRWQYKVWLAHARLRREAVDSAMELVGAVGREVAGLGRPELPTLHEPEMWGPLLELTEARARQGMGARRMPVDGPVASSLHIRLLGGFAVVVDGEEAGVPSGKPQQLVKLLALAARPVPDEEAADRLWPDAEPDIGRRRLRNVVARVRAAAPVLDRGDGLLSIAPAVSVDAIQFESGAQTALRSPVDVRLPRALAAAERYHGEVLPEDRFEDWTTLPREQLRQLATRLLESIVEDSEQVGDIDGAVSAIERLIEVDPFDDTWARRASTMLAAAGRPSSARAWADRAHRIRRDLGFE